MKRNLLTFAAAALLFALAACDKDSGSGGVTRCYTCVSTSTYTGTGTTGKPTTVTNEVCGLTAEGARNTEKAGTYTATSGTTTVTSTMSCN
ncbi:MAG: hypothetical protein LBK47_05115 [Prevotellaceae bacterium]|jgi:hypothetical protein|nr:hypothetical protein [Prevotellaceae bacterium]